MFMVQGRVVDVDLPTPHPFIKDVVNMALSLVCTGDYSTDIRGVSQTQIFALAAKAEEGCQESLKILGDVVKHKEAEPLLPTDLVDRLVQVRAVVMKLVGPVSISAWIGKAGMMITSAEALENQEINWGHFAQVLEVKGRVPFSIGYSEPSDDVLQHFDTHKNMGSGYGACTILTKAYGAVWGRSPEEAATKVVGKILELG